MSTLCRLVTGALLKATPRTEAAAASFSHSAILSSAALTVEQYEAPNVPGISDIFDAPTKLRERIIPDRPLKTLSILSGAQERIPRPATIYDDPLGSPWSLPPPVVFDGPACPPHMSPSTLKKRRLQRKYATPPPRGSSAVSCSTLMSQSNVLYQLFDGPSRVTRFQYPTSVNDRFPYTYVSFALCISTAFGWLTLKENLEPKK